MDGLVQILYSTDINYVTPTAVSIISLMENSNPNRNYNVNVIVDEDIKTVMEGVLKIIQSKYSNLNYKVIVMKDRIDSVSHIDHVSLPTFYRIYISKYVDYDKCVYLDSDTIVNGDIGTLFDLDLGDKLIAGIKPACYYYNKREVRWRSKLLNIPIFDQYINAGVILYNLKMIRNSKIDDVLINEMKKNPDLNDQDLINMVYYGNIKVINTKWNLMSGDYTIEGEKVLINSDASKILDTKVLDMTDVVVVHYSERDKPWDDVPDSYPLKNLWDNYWMLCREKLSSNILPPIVKHKPLPKKNIIERIKIKLIFYVDKVLNRIM